MIKRLSIIIIILIGIFVEIAFFNQKQETTDNTCLNTNERLFEEQITKELEERYPYKVVIVNSSELSKNEIESRSNEVLVEKCMCQIIDDEGTGVVLNVHKSRSEITIHELNYSEGDYVLIYLVYDPFAKDLNIVRSYTMKASKEF